MGAAGGQGRRKDGHAPFKWHNVKTTFPSANADPVRAADSIAGNYNGSKLFALCMRPGFVYGRVVASLFLCRLLVSTGEEENPKIF